MVKNWFSSLPRSISLLVWYACVATCTHSIIHDFPCCWMWSIFHCCRDCYSAHPRFVMNHFFQRWCLGFLCFYSNSWFSWSNDRESNLSRAQHLSGPVGSEGVMNWFSCKCHPRPSAAPSSPWGPTTVAHTCLRGLVHHIQEDLPNTDIVDLQLRWRFAHII